MIAILIVAGTACDKMKIWKNFESEGFLFRVIGFRFENHQVVLENIWTAIDYFPGKTRETGSKNSEKYYINNKNCKKVFQTEHFVFL